eukprot:6853708-Pyramimonas_sp.AAC.1
MRGTPQGQRDHHWQTTIRLNQENASSSGSGARRSRTGPAGRRAGPRDPRARSARRRLGVRARTPPPPTAASR